MGSRQAELAYRERVARVVAAIVADPMAEHRLEDLAVLARFSTFHFHRVYSAVVGESVAATVRRVRLALATRSLAEGDSSITQVGLASGYDSPQAFTRAFRGFTGQSPRAFREQMRSAVLEPVESPGHVPVVERAAQQVFGLRHCGPFSTIAHTHRRLRGLVRDRAVSDWLGISSGDPDVASHFSYRAALTAPEAWPEHEVEIERFDVPAGLYAVHVLAGAHTRINAAVRALYGQWLPGSGYEPDDRPVVERYLNSARQVAPAALRTELLIPVRPAR